MGGLDFEEVVDEEVEDDEAVDMGSGSRWGNAGVLVVESS